VFRRDSGSAGIPSCLSAREDRLRASKMDGMAVHSGGLGRSDGASSDSAESGMERGKATHTVPPH
jgi:hypothetical protein